MMKYAALLAAATFTIAAGGFTADAQSFGITQPTDNSFSVGSTNETHWRSPSTPSTRRRAVARAAALRNEAFRLQAADGGQLSPQHLAYVRRQARIILAEE